VSSLRKPVWILWILLLLTLGKSAPFSVAYSDFMASAHCQCCSIKNPDCRHCAEAKPKLKNKIDLDGGLYAVDCQGKKASPDFYQAFVSDAFVTEKMVQVSRIDFVVAFKKRTRQVFTLIHPILSPPPKSV